MMRIHVYIITSIIASIGCGEYRNHEKSYDYAYLKHNAIVRLGGEEFELNKSDLCQIGARLDSMMTHELYLHEKDDIIDFIQFPLPCHQLDLVFMEVDGKEFLFSSLAGASL